jgi:hypothetical protein
MILGMPSPALLAIALVLFVLLLAPTGRLQRAGWRPRALGTYLLGMLLMGLLVAELPVTARFLVPVVVLGFLAPFVSLRAGIDRLRRPGRPAVVERPPIKTVHGPARDIPPTDVPDEAPPGARSGTGQDDRGNEG